MIMDSKQACKLVETVSCVIAQPSKNQPYPRRLFNGFTLSQVSNAYLIATAHYFSELSLGNIDLDQYKKFKNSADGITPMLKWLFIRNEDWDQLGTLAKSSKEHRDLKFQSRHIKEQNWTQEEIDFSKVELVDSFAKYVESLDPSSSLYWQQIYQRIATA